LGENILISYTGTCKVFI